MNPRAALAIVETTVDPPQLLLATTDSFLGQITLGCAKNKCLRERGDLSS